MVTLTISPKRGNHARFFPHSGYLGLTPVIVTGVVETRLEEDRQPIEASRLVVRIRCYEAIGSSLSKGTRPEHQQQRCTNKSWSSSSSSPHYSGTSTAVKNNEFSNVNVLWQTEKTLWTAASHRPPRLRDDGDNHDINNQYDSLGDWKGSWRLVIPTSAVANHGTLPPSKNANNHQNHNHTDVILNSGSAVGSITYKGWRSWWQVETVIYHKPAGVLGTKIMKSHGLHLVNYGEAQKHYNRSIEESRTSIQSAARMSNRNLRYSITAPSSVCCGDEVELVIRIASSSTHQCFNNHHQDRTDPTTSLDPCHSQTDPCCHVQLPEYVHRPTTQATTKDSLDRSNPSDITLKRLQVSLVRRLAIELIKSPSSNSKNDPSSHGKDDLQHKNPPMISHSSSGSNKNLNNSQVQLTTFNTLTTNKDAISKSNALFNLNNCDSLVPSSPSPSRPRSDAYDLGLIVKLKIPVVKSKSHYSVGETFNTNSTKVNFFFQFKLSVKNKLTNRIEIVELNELNVQVFSISKEQIKFALDQLNQFNENNSNNALYQNRLLLNASSSPNINSQNETNDSSGDS